MFSFIFFGCKGTVKKEQGRQVVLATVNGVHILGDEVVARLGGHGDGIDQAAKDKAIDAVIADELLYQKAVKLGFDKDPKFQDSVRMMEMKIMAYKRAEMGRRVRDTQIASHVAVTEQEAKDYYEKHADEFGTDLHLGVLQFPDAVKAGETAARVSSGTPFEKIAAEQFADAPKKMHRAWDKGFLHWDQVPAAFTGDVYRLKKSEVSGVLVSGPSEAYIVKVIDRRKNTTATFDKVKPTIENRLWTVKGRAAYESYIAQLQREASIKKNVVP
jgi:parvulin-like peptidyl-prolyl isomerase